MLRVDVILGGSAVVGGGINQLFFSNDAVDAQACADAAQDFWDVMAFGIHNSCTYQVSSTVLDINQVTGELVGAVPVTTLAAAAGGASSDREPPVLQGLLRLNTGQVVNGRVLKGRLFIPAVPDSFVNSDGSVSGSYGSGMTAAAIGLIDDATASWNIWHRPIAGSGGTMRTVQSASVSGKFSVLRSRRD